MGSISETPADSHGPVSVSQCLSGVILRGEPREGERPGPGLSPGQNRPLSWHICLSRWDRAFLTGQCAAICYAARPQIDARQAGHKMDPPSPSLPPLSRCSRGLVRLSASPLPRATLATPPRAKPDTAGKSLKHNEKNRSVCSPRSTPSRLPPPPPRTYAPSARRDPDTARAPMFKTRVVHPQRFRIHTRCDR